MGERSVVVIGAGLAGLAAGVYARLCGYETTVLEHAGQPGGVAAWWRRGDWLVDGGIHFLAGWRPGDAYHELYRQLGTAQAGSVVPMTEYGRWVDEATGRNVWLGADIERAEADLRRYWPREARSIERFFAGVRRYRATEGDDGGLAEPPELAGRLADVGQLWLRRSTLWMYGGWHRRRVAHFAGTLGDPALARLFEALFLPEVPLWFLYVLLGWLADGRLGLLAHGCEGFVRPIEDRYRGLGGVVEYGATVERILVQGDRVRGVRLADGRELSADAVVAAGDGRRTLFDLLEGRYVDEATRARYRDWRLVAPWVVCSLGVARDLADSAHYVTYELAEPFCVGPTQVRRLAVRVLNYSPNFAPEGRTLVQPCFETSWEHWEGLWRRDRRAYEEEKARVLETVIGRLEAHLPGLGAQVEMADVATPVTFWRYTLNDRGAYMGWLPTGPQLLARLPRTLPGLEGLVMAGQWVMPGGGVPACLASGRDAVRVLCRRDGRAFRAEA